MSYDLDQQSMELLGRSSLSEQPTVPDEFRALSGTGAHMGMPGDAFEGSSRISRELASYNPPRRSADLDLLPAKDIMDTRSRDLARNDSYIRGGVTLRKDNIVGAYYMLNARPNSLRLFGKEDTVWEDDFQEEVEDLFGAYAEGPDNWIDATGRNTLTGLVRMAIEQHTLSGEIVASAEWDKDGDRPFRTTINLIDPDRLSTPHDKMADKSISMGVKMDASGKPIGYYIRDAHPSDWRSGKNGTWTYVPKKHPKLGRSILAHAFEQCRPGQTRGIGVITTAIPEMRMAKEFRNIVMQNAILNATFAATMETENPIDAQSVFAALGGTDYNPAKLGELLSGYAQSYYGMLNDTVGDSRNLHFGGVKIPFLPPGVKLHLQGAGQGGPLGGEYESSLHRAMATAFGVSYEQWSRDYSETNYSSFKGALNETQRAMKSIKRGFADVFASWAYRLWLEEALNAGAITSIKRRMPSFYEGLNKEWYCACDWIGASRGQIDELKETEAAGMRIEKGLSTHAIELGNMGQDWKRIFRQMKREQEWAKEYDILQAPVEGAKAPSSSADNGTSDEKPKKKKEAANG